MTTVKTKEVSEHDPVSSTEEKPKTSGFPLDHILPVFNLNKKESNFIPTIKHKSKAEYLAFNNIKDKKTSGLVKGNTVVHSHQVSKASIESNK